MDVREILFAICLIVAGSMIVAGVNMVSGPAAFVLGGLMFAGWSWLILSEPGGTE